MLQLSESALKSMPLTSGSGLGEEGLPGNLWDADERKQLEAYLRFANKNKL